MIIRLLSIWSAFLAVARAAQPSAPEPIAAPLRDLPWGQLNFLHTTDTHGWHAGHLQEPSYSGDWGDYVSFAQRLRERSDDLGTDLLLVDTGDRIEGNGLYDASDPKGKFTTDIFKEQDIDIICSGNHELYKQNSSETEYLETVPNFHGNYIASNLDIYDPKTGDRVPLARRYRKITTKNQGIRIIAFGFLFDFVGNCNNTVVQPVEGTIKEQWFQEAIRDRDVDLFVVAGHVPLRSKEYAAVFKAIRQQQWDTPIQFFGGHTHIRDYMKYDSKASIHRRKTTHPSPQPLTSPTFSRRYIDNNLFSLHHHTHLNSTTFPTPHGTNVSALISSARKTLSLDSRFGCAPTDLWTNRAPYPSQNSIFTWLEESVLPDIGRAMNLSDKAKLLIANTGAIRFDIFQGPFTRDSTYSVSPFTGGFRYLESVPYRLAQRVLPLLNSAGPMFSDASPALKPWMLAPPEQMALYRDNAIAPASTPFHHPGPAQFPLDADSTPHLTPGYTTVDDAGADGDDTLHERVSMYRVPNCIEALVGAKGSATAATAAASDHDGGNDSEPQSVDLVFLSFIQPWILLALRFLGGSMGRGYAGVGGGRGFHGVDCGVGGGELRGRC
ncbi:MAG: Ser Thr phosphatase family [Lasallia pustulata]|uniref:Ser Thr phosphatase family n=1 Tax=Lasallia pustulata TaxID=136370 RepID=A0A5M8PSI2_9LECA|nr:MAG: Ser Thr phosphatase family [Lasallia pustulata]